MQIIKSFEIQSGKPTPPVTLRQVVRYPHYETIFKVVFFIVLCFTIVCYIPDMAQFRQFMSDQEYRRLHFSDFKWLMVGLVTIHIGKALHYWLSYEWVLRTLNEKYVGEDRIIRSKKITKWIWDVIYFSITLIVAWVLFRDEKWFYNEIGGTQFVSLFIDYPHITTNPWLPVYYMVQASSHLHSLLLLLVYGTKIELKYWEYLLHHTLAASLIYFSSMYNIVTQGVVVLVLHDFSDLFLALGRAMADLSHVPKVLIYILYMTIQLSWIYTRVYVFPQLIWETYVGCRSLISEEYGQLMQPGYLYIVGLMATLYLMHVYWTFYMVKVGTGIFKSGRYKNVYDNRENKLDSKKD